MTADARGAVAFTARDGSRRTLRYTNDALCRIEAALGCPITALQDRLQEPSLTDLRAVFHAGLVDGGDLVVAGELVTIAEMSRLVGEALTAAFSPPAEGGGGAPENPRTTTAGAGPG